MNKQRLISNIEEESEEDTLPPSASIPVIQQPSKMKYTSDEEALRLYEQLTGDYTPIPKPTYTPTPISKQPVHLPPEQSYKSESPSPNKKLTSNQQVRESNRKSVFMEQQREAVTKPNLKPKPPRPPVLSENSELNNNNMVSQQARKTNYSSETYEEMKPFSVKRTADTKSKVRQENNSLSHLPSGSESMDKPKQRQSSITRAKAPLESHKSQSTSQNFKKKLLSNVVKDQEDTSTKRSNQGALQSGSVELRKRKLIEEKMQRDQKLKQQLLDINNEEIVLQAELRKLHLDTKIKTLDIYSRHSINTGFKAVEELNPEVNLVLDEDSHEVPLIKTVFAGLPKKLKYLNQDKEYQEDILLQIRKLNFLLRQKSDNVRVHETAAYNNPIHYYVYEYEPEPEPVPTEPEPSIEKTEDDGPTQEYSSYRQIMKVKRNKNLQLLQRIHMEAPKPGVTSSNLMHNNNSRAVANNSEKYTGEEDIRTYDIQGEARLKVNLNLKNLLLN